VGPTKKPIWILAAFEAVFLDYLIPTDGLAEGRNMT
jgi:hypothetical protein